ncbi:prenyltransferase/squalene oxidase repeat-containing protein [Lignipirellula cremea]|nr:prenyltransferase/squalene oxidase repeat-containing protein [Lignipirellula cremea]
MAADQLGPDQKLYDQTVSKAIAYLRTKGQAEDGTFTKAAGPGVTALCATALMKAGVSPNDPTVAKSLAYLESMVQPNGGIHAKGSRLPNYETCIIMMCFSEANQAGRYSKQLKGAEKFVRDLQWAEDDDIAGDDYNYGGGGYGGDSRPDLSNTAYLVDALKSVGAGADDQALQKALVFVSRCQNLESEFNTTPLAGKVNDGGFYYTVAAEGAGGKEDANGGLRSYGSMTYAGLKSMVYAGVDADDPRVKAALTWIGKHYTVEANPGMGDAGLYYYYQTFAKALDVTGQDTITDAAGNKHDWRAELCQELAKRQNEDGSFTNSNKRWLEGDANLSTGFALLALSYCKPPAK